MHRNNIVLTSLQEFSQSVRNRISTGNPLNQQAILYCSGSQPVVRGPPVFRDHMPGGPQERLKIYLILR